MRFFFAPTRRSFGIVRDAASIVNTAVVSNIKNIIIVCYFGAVCRAVLRCASVRKLSESRHTRVLILAQLFSLPKLPTKHRFNHR
jgi:hypothetical protein